MISFGLWHSIANTSAATKYNGSILGLKINRTLVPNSRIHGVMPQNQSKLLYTVRFLTFIREVSSSNFDRDTTYRI